MDITTTAQAVQAAQTFDPKALAGVAAGILAAPTLQASIEHAVAGREWCPQWLKPMLPALVSCIVAAVSAYAAGIPVQTAVWGALTATFGAHAVNASSVASEYKKPEVKP